MKNQQRGDMMGKVIHSKPHPLSNKIVRINKGSFQRRLFRLEDYWDRIDDCESWRKSAGENPVAIFYALRVAKDRLPVNDEVVYGKIQGSGCLIHVSEFEEKEYIKSL